MTTNSEIEQIQERVTELTQRQTICLDDVRSKIASVKAYADKLDTTDLGVSEHNMRCIENVLKAYVDRISEASVIEYAIQKNKDKLKALENPVPVRVKPTITLESKSIVELLEKAMEALQGQTLVQPDSHFPQDTQELLRQIEVDLFKATNREGIVAVLSQYVDIVEAT